MLYILQHLHPTASRHIDVKQQYVMSQSEQLGQHLIPVAGFRNASVNKCVSQNLSQAAPNVRMIICN